MEENWKDIPGYEGRYQVSDQGRVRSLDQQVKQHSAKGKLFFALRKGRDIRDARLSKYGYRVVALHTDAVAKMALVHRLVATCFCPQRADAPEVNHLNGDTSDNRAINLEWVSRRENEQHARKFLGKTTVGKPVKATYADGATEVFSSQSAAEIQFLGKQTGIVSWALRNNKKALGATWERLYP